MRTIADTALGSAVGLTVVAAMFLTIWAASDSSARVSATAAGADTEMPALQSARTHRTPVTRTSITSEQLRALQGRPQDTERNRFSPRSHQE